MARPDYETAMALHLLVGFGGVDFFAAFEEHLVILVLLAKLALCHIHDVANATEVSVCVETSCGMLH